MSDNPIDSDLDDRAKMSWRDFIKFLDATGAALTLPSHVYHWEKLLVSTDANTSGTIDSNAIF